jgi:hypothetical protein
MLLTQLIDQPFGLTNLNRTSQTPEKKVSLAARASRSLVPAAPGWPRTAFQNLSTGIRPRGPRASDCVIGVPAQQKRPSNASEFLTRTEYCRIDVKKIKIHELKPPSEDFKEMCENGNNGALVEDILSRRRFVI